jgi:hypothetical protein
LSAILIRPPAISVSSHSSGGLFSGGVLGGSNTEVLGVGDASHQRAGISKALVVLLRGLEPALIAEHLTPVCTTLMAVLNDPKALASPTSVLQVSACLGYVIRRGICDRLSESHQLSLAQVLCELLAVGGMVMRVGVCCGGMLLLLFCCCFFSFLTL